MKMGPKFNCLEVAGDSVPIAGEAVEAGQDEVDDPGRDYRFYDDYLVNRVIQIRGLLDSGNAAGAFPVHRG